MSDEIKRGRLFVGCIFALVATAMGFVVRGQILGDFRSEFNLSQSDIGVILGVGLFPFAISIILFSLIVDKIGYGTSMCFAFLGHVASAILTILAGFQENPETGFQLVYIGTFVYALANGIVEAVVNPVTATMFPEKKTHYLNILHAGWPLGLVLGALLALGVGALPQNFIEQLPFGLDVWQWKVALVLIPTLIYGLLLFRLRFPVQERVSAGVSYSEMMREFGAASCFIVMFLLVTGIFQIIGIFDLPELNNLPAMDKFYIAGAIAAVTSLLFAVVFGKQGAALSVLGWLLFLAGGALILAVMMSVFGNNTLNEYIKVEQWQAIGDPMKQLLYASGAVLGLALLLGLAFGNLGRPMFVFLLLVMFLLATTELGTDSWIQDIMKEVLADPGSTLNYGALVLAYTSLIMFVLRFFAGPIVHRISPLGLLAASAAIAAGGLFWLANAGSTVGMVFAAATLYGVGKTFFWPTTLGVVSEQFPKGGALTLNAIAGVGMIAIGVLGNPMMGDVQDLRINDAINASHPAARLEIMKTDDKGSLIEEAGILPWKQNRIDQDRFDKFKETNKDEGDAVTATITATRQKFLAEVAYLPAIMFFCYIMLIGYFKARGGYKAVELDAELESRQEHREEGGAF